MLPTTHFVKQLIIIFLIFSSGIVFAQDPDPYDEAPPDYVAPAPVAPLDKPILVLFVAGVFFAMYSLNKYKETKITSVLQKKQNFYFD
jgi:hypothetical protein